MTFPSVLLTEVVKLRRTKVTWITFIAYTFMVAIAAAFLWMMKNPGIAEQVGLLGQKARFAFGGESVDWASFLTFIEEIGGVGGLIMCSIIVTFIFGREYVEGTAKNLLALPVARSRFVAAKIVVSAAWLAGLTAWMVLVAGAAGVVVGLPGLPGLAGPPAGLLLGTAAKLFQLAAMSLCCALLVAWVAVQTHGYFAPLGFSICTLLLASVFGHTGWGKWVPWSIVGLYSGAAGPVTGIGAGSIVVLAATFLVGTFLTVRHEAAADNLQ